MQQPDVFIGRQPISDAQQRPHGYALLFASSNGPLDASVLQDVSVRVGLDRLAGDVRAVVHIERDWLTDDSPAILPPGRVILAVDDSVVDEPEAIAGMRRLASRGYAFALRTAYALRSELLPALQLVDRVTLDADRLDWEHLHRQVAVLQGLVDLAIENVHSTETMDRVRHFPFDYYQGTWQTAPAPMTGKPLTPNQAGLLGLVAALRSPGVQLRDLESIIAADLSLSYNLLRYINSAYYAFARRIASVQQAVALLGINNVRTFAMILALSRSEVNRPELTNQALLRARMCESLGRAIDPNRGDDYFTVGLFSLAPLMVGADMEAIVDCLPFNDEVNSALLECDGQLGQALACVLAYERCDWQAVRFGAVLRGEIRAAFLDALNWSAQTTSRLAA